MVPGLVAGHYPRDAVAIDLRQLSDQAGVAFVVAEITGLDPVQKQLHLQGRPSLSYDRLSLNVQRHSAGRTCFTATNAPSSPWSLP